MINKAYAAIARAADKKTQQVAGLSSTQLGVLLFLSRRDGQTATELAKSLSVRKSSLSGLIDRMEERGLVQRKKDLEDRRVVRIYLQAAALDLLQRTMPVVRHINGQMLAPFDEAEVAIIARFLTHVAENAETLIAQAAPPKE
ncbi:MarR family winged helix-turn-helix transcriptional regulator [Shimia sp.]|uniref:MarR family winged helix-turn-helix transcriptional regulator n=1 Tax=Shimia sp. TaxID=1954381 RepID=UPI003B8E12CD